VPGDAYIFKGGSLIRFTEAPKSGDSCKILFYRGTSLVDTQDFDVLEPVEVGDKLKISSDFTSLDQKDRIVYDILSSDTVKTNTYPGPGISIDENLLRPVKLCKQTEDLFIDGNPVSKSRREYEALIYPNTNIIRSVGIASTVIFVENLKTFFDSEKEYDLNVNANRPQRGIAIISQDNLVAASATAIVSYAGTISSIVIDNGGVGYTANPIIALSRPIGLGITSFATAVSSISSGVVTSISVVNSGYGYTNTNPPLVLIEPPKPIVEKIADVNFSGDFGIISGIKTTSVGLASTGLILDLFIPENSFIRNISINSVGIATTGISGIQTGYYFTINNSNIGNSLTSLDMSGNVIGVGITFIDNIYQAVAVSIAQTSVLGIGLTFVAQVTVSVSNYNGLTGIGFSNFYGEYSWGRIENLTRNNPKSFTSYSPGISSSPVVMRLNPLKYVGYSTT
jgi:hypothetical protein